MSKKDTIRINLAIDLDLNEKLEKYAYQRGVSKAGFVRFILYEYFRQDEAMQSIKQIEKLEELFNKKD